jgi:hypothetical protein
VFYTGSLPSTSPLNKALTSPSVSLEHRNGFSNRINLKPGWKTAAKRYFVREFQELASQFSRQL